MSIIKEEKELVASYNQYCAEMYNRNRAYRTTARSIKLWDFLAPYYGRFRRKIVEKTVIFCRFFAENDQSESPGVLIKSGVLYARLW